MSAAGRPTVLLVLDTLETGGTETSTLELARRLGGFRPVVAHLHPAANLAPRFRQAGIPVVCLEVTGRHAYRRAARRVLSLARRENAALVHSALWGAGMACRLARRRLDRPLIHSWVNDPAAHPRLDDGRYRWKKKVVQRLDAWTAGRVDHFIANSRTVALSNRLALGVGEGRVRVIPRGRDPERFRPLPAAVAREARRELGIGDHERVLLQVARLWRWKGQRLLVEAFRRVVAEIPEARLVLVGEGPERAFLERRVADLGLGDRVLLTGERRDVPRLLSIAEVFVHPSWAEGLPGALLEALLAERPVVVSDIEVHREVVDDGETGLRADREPAALAAALLRLLRDGDLARRLAAAGRRDALARFTVDRMVERHEELYRQVLGAP